MQKDEECCPFLRYWCTCEKDAASLGDPEEGIVCTALGSSTFLFRGVLPLLFVLLLFIAAEDSLIFWCGFWIRFPGVQNAGERSFSSGQVYKWARDERKVKRKREVQSMMTGAGHACLCRWGVWRGRADLPAPPSLFRSSFFPASLSPSLTRTWTEGPHDSAFTSISSAMYRASLSAYLVLYLPFSSLLPFFFLLFAVKDKTQSFFFVVQILLVVRLTASLSSPALSSPRLFFLFYFSFKFWPRFFQFF